MILALIMSLKVMSADFCADQYALALADRADIVALSPDAGKDFSRLRDAARGLPQARPDIETVARRRPDVILRFWGGDAARLDRFAARMGARVITLPYVSDFAGVEAVIREAAAALDQEARGDALIAEMRARLGAIAADGPVDARAVYVTPGGVTAGAGTMIDAIITAAGARNAVADAGLSYWPALPAEQLVIDPPQMFVGGFFNAASERADNWSAARHPAVARTLDGRPGAHLPPDTIACPGWFAVDAAAVLRSAAEAAR